jgi:hypothetical protein
MGDSDLVVLLRLTLAQWQEVKRDPARLPRLLTPTIHRKTGKETSGFIPEGLRSSVRVPACGCRRRPCDPLTDAAGKQRQPLGAHPHAGTQERIGNNCTACETASPCGTITL